MQKRNLEELNLLDDFLMGSVLSYPGIGPEVCRRMVSIILNREIKPRFYHAKIDADSLASGEDYGKLKNVIVIFICPYDPFQLNRMVYTIKSCCVEEPGLVYEDGARTIFLLGNCETRSQS